MCGLAGAYGPAASLGRVEAALDRLAHRGPDGRGVAAKDGAIHGHVRLALVDLSSASAQPFRDRGALLSFNGEIWNFRELRAELEAAGYAFSTSGDTEVLAAALDAWGQAALARLDGMFAFAWSRAGRHILVRDRYGKIPLYVLRRGATFEWASERKAWAPGPAGAAAPLPPGSVLDLATGAVRAWYTVPETAPAVDLLEALEASVTARLAADAPVCCLISGGLDSSMILALAARRRPDVVAYTASFDPEAEDLLAARRICRELDVELREVAVKAPSYASIAAAVAAIEIASKAQVEIALLCLPLAARIAADGFKAALSGEGADELFGAYGNMKIKGWGASDAEWRSIRLEALAKMARGNFVRCNKVFMDSGVEARLPFLAPPIVELALGSGLRECPPAKVMLKRAATNLLPAWVIKREKETFQGGSGISVACASLLDSPIRYYNTQATARFGARVTS
jgi:asparagine synthase (glutamine-hydrolysing)